MSNFKCCLDQAIAGVVILGVGVTGQKYHIWGIGQNGGGQKLNL